jgi:flagellar biosynthesis GTPase FlhF
MSVKVAVRVRPFNPRERELNSELCVDMSGNTTVLTNPEDKKTRDFTFDYSFWSHDEFEEDEGGYFKATSTNKYADQQRVFSFVGKEVLDNAWEGYHCCLFAYGQTGAGKSYSMVGYGTNKGIVPISMKEIFERIGANTDPNISFEVSFSMLEIYNERIQDLLISCKERTAEGLKVREHLKYGVYVEGLKKIPVESYDAIESKMEEGNKNRTIGSTLMNNSSSRAHTIIQIEFKKIEIIDKKRTERFSVINLVDLAGSEKLSKTGASGDRMKEGCAINKSLSTLGLVISKLADRSMGKKNVLVPYRDSVLTRILQNALGGNSKTLMICAISPATDNYEETLSTLRYADQAKKIKCNAVINESEQDKMIRELREENDKLKALLQNYKPGEATENFKMIDEETMRKYQEMEEQMRANALLMQDYEKTFQERLAEAAKEKSLWPEDTIDKTKPYFMNLNEDPILSGKVCHSLAKEKIFIGRKNGDPVPDIVLGGIGIKANHAVIHNDAGRVTILPCDEECGEYIYCNGAKVFEERELFNNDRIIFGTNSTFIFKNPGFESEEQVKDSDIDWEYAQTELVDTMNKEKKINLDEGNKERQKEVEEKIKSIEEEYQKGKNETETTIKKQRDEFERKIQELENRNKKESEQQKFEMERKEAEREFRELYSKYEAEKLQKERERERMQKEVQEEATLKRYKEQEKIYLEQKLAKNVSHITEMNLIAKELKRDITFSVKLIYNYVSGAELSVSEKFHKPKVQILVQNRETNTKYIWPMTKFTNRYFLIQDLLNRFYENHELPPKNQGDDPFWDPPEPNLIGQGFVCLESLAYLLDNSAEITLVGDAGPCGKLNVNTVPCDDRGDPLGDNGDLIDDPVELNGKKLDFLIQIDNAELIDPSCQDTYCEYSLLSEDGKELKSYKTSIIQGVQTNPQYNYKYHHTYPSVNDKILNYMLNHNLKIQLFGFDIPEVIQEPSPTKPERAERQTGTESSPTTNTSTTTSTTTTTKPSPPKFKKPLQINTEEGGDNSFKRASAVVEPETWNEEKYRSTVFAPGAAVNKNKAITPRVQTQLQKAKDAEKEKTKEKDRKTKGDKPKDDNCNIF